MQGGEEQLHADHMALSPGQHSTVPTAPPVAKENTAVTSSTASTGGHFMGTPTLVSPQWDHRSICGLNHWESDCDGEREIVIFRTNLSSKAQEKLDRKSVV